MAQSNSSMAAGTRLFFRDDDVWTLDPLFKKMLGLFLWHGVPVHLAVIPGKMTEECGDFLRRCSDKYPALVEIGQHGYRHENHAPEGAVKYEFGPLRTYVQQRADIEAGAAILRRVSGDVSVFTPPWHGFDPNTLQAVSDLGFTKFATDQKSCVSDCPTGLVNIRTSVYVNKKTAAGWFAEQTENTLREIRGAGMPAVGVLLHHHAFHDEKEIDRLNELLSRLKVLRGVRFCRLSEAGGEQTQGGAR